MGVQTSWLAYSSNVHGPGEHNDKCRTDHIETGVEVVKLVLPLVRLETRQQDLLYPHFVRRFGEPLSAEEGMNHVTPTDFHLIPRGSSPSCLGAREGQGEGFPRF